MPLALWSLLAHALDCSEGCERSWDPLLEATAHCGPLQELEVSALLGQLSPDQARCLERALQDQEPQVYRDKLSRVLLADAWARGDVDGYIELARRQMTGIRPDPDVGLRLVRVFQTHRPEQLEEAARWADLTLDLAGGWAEGSDLRAKRLSELHQRRTDAHRRLWVRMAEYAEDGSSDALKVAVDYARERTLDAALAWLDHAEAAGTDPLTALEVCRAAASDTARCLPQPGAPVPP